MTTVFQSLHRWLCSIQLTLDRLLYGFSAYALPVLIALVSLAAFLSWENHYPDNSAIPLKFQVMNDAEGALTPQQARSRLATAPAVAQYETRLTETPFWFLLDGVRTAGEPATAIEFPSRHALQISCWDAGTLQLLGQASRLHAQGAISAVKAGFALELKQPLLASRVLCRTNFIGPARLTILKWPASQLGISEHAFHRNAGLLDGGMIILAVFMLITALISHEKTYIIFAAWLFVSLRVGALSAGWDFQWLGRTFPADWILQGRLATISLYYVVTLTLFKALFRDELGRIGYGFLINTMQWVGAALLPMMLVLPYARFLPVFWIAAAIGIPVLLFLMARILLFARSQVAIWYSASIAITLGAGLYEILASALGYNNLLNTVNSVTAALSSSLLASLALAAQMRSEHQDRIMAQAELRHNYEAMPIGLFTLDLHGCFLSANPALNSMLGHDVLAARHNLWHQHFHAGAWSQLLDLVHASTGTELEIQGKEKNESGEPKRFLIKAALSQGKIEGWLQDVTEKSKANENLRFMALNDPLTRVYNRHGVEKIFHQAMQQLADGKPLAIAYLDLDRFKLINDLYGHATGDQVLRRVCERITSMLSGAHHIGRVGGDEFVIVMPDTTIQPATWICRGIIESVCTEPYRIGDKAFQVGVSIGLIDVSPGTQMKDALANADRACRQAKHRHNESLVVYEKNARAFLDREAELLLVERLSDNDCVASLFLEMQPIMSLKTPHASLNFEVLLRMHDTDGSVIPAGRVIGAAENSGRTGMIDRWVLATTLAWLNQRRDQLSATRFVCMNLSGASLNDERFVQDAYTMLAENPEAASLLCIEITESVALHDLHNTRQFIDKVHGYGVKVALDDFGAGYTSFSYLKELPADVLKIDGSFIVNMNEHPTNIAIVEAIVNLAMSLGMKTIAEWAEDNATVQTLTEIGVDYVQGYAVARPQDPANLLQAESSASFIKDPVLASFVRSLGEPDTITKQSDLLDFLYAKNLH